MDTVFQVALQFEEWSRGHVDLDLLDDAWPISLENSFGRACFIVVQPKSLATFDDRDCLRVALHMRLPLRLDGALPVPVDVMVSNPARGTGFRELRIQTVRNAKNDNTTCPFRLDDDPFDESFEAPLAGLYGVGEDGLDEHIADRQTYAEAVALAQKLVPGITFPTNPTWR